MEVEPAGSRADMQPRCSHCGREVQRQIKGYKRKSLLTVLDLKSASTLFPRLDPHDAFLCFDCVRDVYHKTKKCGKRRVYVDPNPPTRPAPAARPAPSVPAEPPPLKKLKKRLRSALNEHDYASQNPAPSDRTEPPPARRGLRGPISQVCGYLRRRKFSCALNRLLQVNGFKDALLKVCGRIISSEVRHSCPHTKPQSQKHQFKNIGFKFTNCKATMNYSYMISRVNRY